MEGVGGGKKEKLLQQFSLHILRYKMLRLLNVIYRPFSMNTTFLEGGAVIKIFAKY